jgi:hypothetical protein
MRGDLEMRAYAYPVPQETPSSPKAQRWMGRRDDDGEGGQAGRRLDAVSWMVTRFSSRVAKLCTGPPPVVAFVASRMVALAGQRHPATGAGRLIP